MVHKKIKQLSVAKAALAKIESFLATELPKKLAALPGEFGFVDPGSFAAAVHAAHSAKPGPKKAKRGRKPGKKAKAPRSVPTKKPRTRAVITNETRTQVKKLVEEGKTGAQIAHALKISLPSVQNIKKSLGLVKARK